MAMQPTEEPISKLIDKIIAKNQYRRDKKQVFDDIIQLSFNTVFSAQFQSMHPTKSISFKVSDKLLNELTDYKNSLESWELLQQAYMNFIGLFAEAEPFSDVLGVLYDEHLGDVLGQFLTPPDVASFIGELNVAIDDAESVGDSIADMTGCGAGSLLLGQISAFNRKYGAKKLSELKVYGMDLDFRMVQLTALQIVLHCIMHNLHIKELSLYCGNALTDYDNDTLAVRWIPEPLNPQQAAFNKIMERFRD